MSFASDLSFFNAKVRGLSQRAFVEVAQATKGSIVDGSPITAAPGQPVDTGNLKASWILGFPSATLAEITTNVVYAPVIEFNVRGAKLRSQVGGFHSVGLTIGGFQRLVESVVARMGTV